LATRAMPGKNKGPWSKGSLGCGRAGALVESMSFDRRVAGSSRKGY